MAECECSKKGPVRPMDLPIYSQNLASPVKAKVEEEKSAAIEAVGVVRSAINDGWRQMLVAKEQVDHVVETGKAHTSSSLAMLKEDENLPLRAGFIASGGLFFLTYAAIRGRGKFGKLLYTALGSGLCTSALYPDETVAFGKDMSGESERLTKIAINFVQGVQPQDIVDKAKSTLGGSKSSD